MQPTSGPLLLVIAMKAPSHAEHVFPRMYTSGTEAVNCISFKVKQTAKPSSERIAQLRAVLLARSFNGRAGWLERDQS